jgi:hypothetical protein
MDVGQPVRTVVTSTAGRAVTLSSEETAFAAALTTNERPEVNSISQHHQAPG